MHPFIEYLSKPLNLRSPIVHVTYTNFRQCETDPSHCSGICRCGKITDVVIRSVDLNLLVAQMVKHCYPQWDQLSPRETKELQSLIYCLDRVLRIRRLYLPSNWSYRVEPGYYGEEFHGCMIHESCQKQILSDLDRLLVESPADQIRWVLELEYGYVLPILQNCTFRWRRVPRESIMLGCPNHYTRVSTENLDHYQKYQLPRCICRHELDGSYWIVDGYHRFQATPVDSPTVLICVIVPPTIQSTDPSQPEAQL